MEIWQPLLIYGTESNKEEQAVGNNLDCYSVIFYNRELWEMS